MPDYARLLKRVFGIGLEHCPQCGGDSKIIAAIEEPAVIVKILADLVLPARATELTGAARARAKRSNGVGRRRGGPVKGANSHRERGFHRTPCD